jgi:hypothetical protein
MNAAKQFSAAVVIVLASAVMASAEGESPRSATNTAATNRIAADVPLTNRAVQVIAKLRGVEPSEVKLRPGQRPGGPFEIDINGVPDGRHEAEELSRELGAGTTVVFEHVSGDGVTRTNWSFRDGAGRKVTAPAGPTGLGPNAKRMYVWPQNSVRIAAPAEVRVRTKEND